MAPLVPRLHLFEIDDQPWFPPFLRERVQDGLMHAWTFHLPVFESCSPATLVANILSRILGKAVRDYTYIDFCAGAGGPTPFIERDLNRQLTSSPASASSTASAHHAQTNGKEADEGAGAAPSYADVTSYGENATHDTPVEPVQFIMTDLHPHVSSWQKVSKKSANLGFVEEPVDAANVSADLIKRYKEGDKKIFRLFNLAFHHFDDPLAKKILQNTVENSEGFGIFELQERTIGSFISCLLFGLGILALAPVYYWSNPLTLFFTYLCPIIPVVLVFDGFVSSLRTRTADEVEHLLRNCGADADDWVVYNGREQFLWPTGYLTWVIAVKRTS